MLFCDLSLGVSTAPTQSVWQYFSQCGNSPPGLMRLIWHDKNEMLMDTEVMKLG